MLNDQEILAMNSPRRLVGGPYVVVRSNDFWAVVALDYDKEPRLGIRWIDDEIGTPQSHGFPTWFIVPPDFNEMFIWELHVDVKRACAIYDFLNGRIDGETLKSLYNE